MTQGESILRALRLAGERGVTNFDLSNYSLRYGARLYELRKKGYVIRKKRLTNTMTRYNLVEG